MEMNELEAFERRLRRPWVLSFAHRLWRKRRALGAALGLAGLATAAAWLPQRAVARAEARDCWRAAEQSEVAAATCEAEARRWLWAAKVTPWTRPRALELDQGLARRRAHAELTAATAVLAGATAGTPNAAARTRAANELFAWARSSSHQLRSHAAAYAFDSGAFAELAAQAPALPFEPDSMTPSTAAFMLQREADSALSAGWLAGDFEAVARAASRDVPRDRVVHMGGLRAAASLCLIGRADEGRAQLHRFAEGTSDKRERSMVWLALAACGGPKPPPLNDHDLSEVRRYLVAPDDEAKASPARFMPEEWRLVAVASYLARVDVSPAEALTATWPSSWNRPLQTPPALKWNPTALLAPCRSPSCYVDDVFVPLATVEAAARKLDAMSETVESALKKAGPRAARASSLDALEPAAGALAAPRSTLRRAAWAIWFTAAFESLRRGDEARARVALERAEAVGADDTALWSAAAHLALGEPGPARAAADRYAASQGAKLASVDAVVLDVQRALAYAHERHFDEALTAAERADERAAKLPRGPGPFDNIFEKSLVATSSWHRAAFTALAKRGAPAGRGAPDLESLWWPKAPRERDEVAFYETLLASDESTRRAWRPKVEFRPHTDALPAQFALAAAAGAGDVDVWLDRQHGLAFAGGLGDSLGASRAAMLARAEVARWLGDDASEARWRERARQLAALVHDDRTMLLAQYAGL